MPVSRTSGVCSIAADLADVALLAFGLGLRLDVVLIVGVSHRLLLGDDARLNDGADEHSVRSQVNVIFNLEREERIDVLREEPKSVVRPHLLNARKLVGRSSRLETEVLENGERRIGRQAVDVHYARLLDDVVRIVVLVDGDRDPVGRVRHLRNGIDDEAVVLLAVV